VCVWVPDNRLGADGAAALVDSLGNLVHLTSLNLSSTWHGGVGCLSRVCIQAVPCPSVCGRL